MEGYTEAEIMDAVRATIRASGLAKPSLWLEDWSSGGRTHAGVAVNYTSALSYASVFAAVSMISGDIASLPLNVYKVDGNGDMDVRRSHPAQWLLNHEPNGVMDALTLREVLQSHALMWGNGYAAIERDGTMRPLRIVPLLPDRTKPIIAADGNLYYETKGRPNTVQGAESEEPEYFLPRDVLHIKGLGYDGYCGHSVITLARQSWGLGLAAEKHGATSMANGARPSITLETDARIDAETADKLLARWEERHGNNANRPALLTNGLKVHPFSMSNEDAQWLESRRFQRVEVAAWFNLPPHKLGDDSKLSYNSIEAENRDYLNRTLKRWLNKWESECERKLVADRERRSRSLVIRHDTEDLVSADIETKVDVLVKLRAAEIVSRNEARRKLGMPGTGPEGDEYTNPNVNSPHAPNDTPDEPQEPADSVDTATRDATSAAIRSGIVATADKLLHAAGRLAVNEAKQSKNYVQWTDTFSDSHSQKMAEAMALWVNTAAALFGEVGVTSTEVGANCAAELKNDLLAAASVAMDTEQLVVHVTETVANWPALSEQIAATIMEGGFNVPSDE